MELYGKDGHSIYFDSANLIKAGSFGEVYRLPNDICYKIFFSQLSRFKDMPEFSEEVFKILKELRLKNFYELYDIFYNKTLTKVTGYSSKFYESEDIDLLTMPTDYTLNNLYNLYDSAKKLSQEGIIMIDTHDDNVILNSSGITVIDTDAYYKADEEDKGEILNSNIHSVLALFNLMYCSAIERYHEQNAEQLIDNMGTLFYGHDERALDITCKKLIKYKYPIDYLKRK